MACSESAHSCFRAKPGLGSIYSYSTLHCATIGVVGCVPLRSKGQLELMTREVLSFTAGLGHAEVIFRCDNEPTMRQLLKYIVSTRLSGIKQSVPGVMIPSAQDSRGSLRSMLRESALWSLAMRSSTPWIPMRTTKT